MNGPTQVLAKAVGIRIIYHSGSISAIFGAFVTQSPAVPNYQ